VFIGIKLIVISYNSSEVILVVIVRVYITSIIGISSIISVIIGTKAVIKG
jgi:hypothetical protein